MAFDSASVDRLRDEILAGGLSRRAVLKRGAALGLSAPLIAGLLAACGDDDDDDPTATTASGQTDPTATTGSGQTDPTATTGGGAEPTATEGMTDEPTNTPAGESPTTAPDTPRGGHGKVTLLYWQAPVILNDHLSQGTKDTHASRVCLEPLFNFDANTEPILALASEYPSVENETLAEDGTWVIFTLREGVKWHDGEDFNAEDVLFTYEYVTNEATTATTLGNYATVESMEIIDDYHIRVNFVEPNPAWFDVATQIVIPEHVMRDYVGEAARDAPFNLMPIGTGPFKVTQFNPGDVVLYDIFEDYWDPGLPHFDSVEIKGGGDATSAARAVMVTGDADWAWNLQVEAQILSQMAEEGSEGALVLQPGTSAERIMINFADPNTEVDGARSEPSTQHPIFQHLQARQALNLAVKRDVVADELYGPGNVATPYVVNLPERLLPPDLTWEYNLEAAQALLAEIDFPAAFDNVNIVYSTSINTVRQKNQEIVKEDLETLGFSVELKSVDSAVYFASDAGNPDTYAHFYVDITMYTNGPGSPYPIAWAERYRADDIAQKSNNWSGTNITRYNNPDFDALHDRARVTIDEAEQEEIWHEMLTLVYDDVVEVPIVYRGGAAAASNRLGGYTPSPWTSTTADIKYWTAS
jgi:peptide/nickel transport system substrate-binding protein